MDDNSHEEGCQVDIVMWERIGIAVVAETEGFLVAHEVHCVGGYCDEQDFHDEDVEGLPAQEQVDVPSQENY